MSVSRLGPKVNTFEHVSSDEHQMSVVGVGLMLPVITTRSHVDRPL